MCNLLCKIFGHDSVLIHSGIKGYFEIKIYYCLRCKTYFYFTYRLKGTDDAGGSHNRTVQAF